MRATSNIASTMAASMSSCLLTMAERRGKVVKAGRGGKAQRILAGPSDGKTFQLSGRGLGAAAAYRRSHAGGFPGNAVGITGKVVPFSRIIRPAMNRSGAGFVLLFFSAAVLAQEPLPDGKALFAASLSDLAAKPVSMASL